MEFTLAAASSLFLAPLALASPLAPGPAGQTQLAPPPRFAPPGSELRERVRIRWESAGLQPIVGEPLTLQLHVLIEERLVREELVQPFARPLDLPIELEVFGEGSGEGRAFSIEPLPGKGPLHLLVDGRMVESPAARVVEQEGSPYLALDLAWRLIPKRPGELALPAARAHLVRAEAFREDLIGGRVPVEPTEWIVPGAALLLEVGRQKLPQPPPSRGVETDAVGGTAAAPPPAGEPASAGRDSEKDEGSAIGVLLLAGALLLGAFLLRRRARRRGMDCCQ